MKLRTKIVLGLACAALCCGIAACSKSTDNYPAYYNPETVEATSEKYVINVRSEGGLPLNGVKVTAYKDGAVMRNSISRDGVIDLAVTLGEYTLEVDEESLKDTGYYLPEGWVAPTTNPDKREEVNIILPSRLLETARTRYTVGQIMSDFTFVDCTGTEHVLSESLTSKKAVVMNFFYTGCGPCRSEFPALQTAYAEYSDLVDVYAICSTHQGDTNEKVSEFKTNNSLSFPMGVDRRGMVSAFNVRSFPTTVVVDRYGLIAYSTTGGEPSPSFWRGLFRKFASDGYTQSLDGGASGGNNEEERALPTVEMSAQEDMRSAALSGLNATFSADEDKYSWPWVAENGYIRSSNAGVDNSYSIVHANVELSRGDVLSFEYNVSSEKDADVLYCLFDGQIFNSEGWSATDGWQSVDVFVADRDMTVDLAFAYQKDRQAADGEDVAKIRNIHKGTLTAPMDVMRPAVYATMQDGATKLNYVDVEFNEEDGLYHLTDEPHSILYACVHNYTKWTDLHMKSKTAIGSDGTLYYNYLDFMSYYLYGNGEEGENLRYIFGNDNGVLTESIIETCRIMGWMGEPYYLVPVNKSVYDWLHSFTVQYEKDYNNHKYYENEWLEFCYYYDHYGDAHNGCKVYEDPTLGMRKENAYTAYEKGDARLATSPVKGLTPGSNRAVVKYPLQTMRGTFYKFTAEQSGVYSIRSNLKNGNPDVEPSLYIVGDDNGWYEEIGGVLNHDYITGSQKYADNDFMTYLVLEANQTVYLAMCVGFGETGSYDFTIEYIGDSYSVMQVCVLSGGEWESEGRLNAIDVHYESAEDCYYAMREDGADYDPDGKVYIDFVNRNYLRYGPLEYRPLRAYLEGAYIRYDSTIDYHNYYKRYSKSGNSYVENDNGDYIFFDPFSRYNVSPNNPTSKTAKQLMQEYLAEATAKPASDPLYGMLEANEDIVYILQQLVDEVCQGGGEGNGWLMLACYMHNFGSQI